jgi:chromosome segregation ATPase
VTVLTVATILLAVIAAGAVWFVRQATVQILEARGEIRAFRDEIAEARSELGALHGVASEARGEVGVLYKQTKDLNRKAQRTEATAVRILDRAYKYQERIDVLMLDPKVQAALNRHNREVT